MDTAGQMGLSIAKPMPVSLRADEQMLVNFLRDKTDWVQSSTIEAALGWDDRKVRRVGSACDYVVSRIGTAGYKFIHNATADEYRHSRNSRRASARALLGKLVRTDKIYYGHVAFLP